MSDYSLQYFSGSIPEGEAKRPMSCQCQFGTYPQTRWFKTDFDLLNDKLSPFEEERVGGLLNLEQLLDTLLLEEGLGLAAEFFQGNLGFDLGELEGLHALTVLAVGAGLVSLLVLDASLGVEG